MFDWLFILLLVFAILLIIFALEYEDNPFWNIISITMSAALWFILALSNLRIESTYQMYNATSGNIETGISEFTSPISPFISYIFMGMGVIMTVYLIAMVFDKWYNYKNWHGGN